MRKSLRYLRITWTVLCGLACILLIVFWIRDHQWYESYVASSRRYCMPIAPVPDLFLSMLLSVCLTGLFVSASPWIAFRFNIRTLLVVTMVVAALLGFAVWAVN
jgi:hypothetical protein